jgi:hypothetical protein
MPIKPIPTALFEGVSGRTPAAEEKERAEGQYLLSHKSIRTVLEMEILFGV